MLEFSPTTQFKKDLKRFKHRKQILQDLNDVIRLPSLRKPLDKKCCDHFLGGNWKGSRECHVNPDVLLIYRVDEDLNKLFLE